LLHLPVINDENPFCYRYFYFYFFLVIVERSQP
jgi:hypothetical protein